MVLALLLAAVLAVAEAAAIGGLFSVINVLVSQGDRIPTWAGLLGAVDRNQFLVRAASVVLGLFLVRGGLGVLVAKLGASLHAETDSWLATTIFRRVLDYPYAVHLQRSSSEVIALLNSATADVAANIVAAVASAGVDSLVLFAMAATLVVLQPVSAVAMIVYFSAVATLVLVVLTPAVRRAAEDEHSAFILVNRSVIEGLHGVKAFQLAVSTGVVSDEHIRHRTDLAMSRQRKVFYAALSRQTLEIAVTIGVALLAFGLFAVRSNASALAGLGVVVAVAFRALPSISRLLATLHGMRSASVSLAKIEDELSEPTAGEGADSRLAPSFGSNVQFVGVSYTYEGTKEPAITDVSLRLAVGSSLGIVGSSGAGKTTVVDLLLGLLEPCAGRIEVDGVLLDGRTILEWRRLVGYVPQEVFLLDSSIRDNVVFEGRGITPENDELAWAALEQAELGTFVRSLSSGLDTLVGERGARMSGGQRQRIGIARALYRRPLLLVLDEATSALDVVTEAAIARTVAGLSTSITKVIVSHRLLTVRACDEIIFLKEGRVSGTGSFDTLVATLPEFEALARLSRGFTLGDQGPSA